MTDRLDEGTPRPPRERDVGLLGILIDGVIAQRCRRHYGADTQEHQLSSRIAEAIERELGGIRIGDMNVRSRYRNCPIGAGAQKRKKLVLIYMSRSWWTTAALP
jgi:hypothetical protein